MSICEDRITEDSTEFEKEFLKIYDGNLWTALDKMKDWQPPMPLPKPYIEVPQFVADWFEEKMSGTFSAVIKSYSFDYNEATAWVHDNGGFNLLCKMKLYDYTVEKEQLYEVIINGLYLIKVMKYDNSKTHGFIEKDKLYKWEETGYKLTEQQIKKIDPRYMAFAVKVEEEQK